MFRLLLCFVVIASYLPEAKAVAFTLDTPQKVAAVQGWSSKLKLDQKQLCDQGGHEYEVTMKLDLGRISQVLADEFQIDGLSVKILKNMVSFTPTVNFQECQQTQQQQQQQQCQGCRYVVTNTENVLYYGNSPQDLLKIIPSFSAYLLDQESSSEQKEMLVLQGQYAWQIYEKLRPVSPAIRLDANRLLRIVSRDSVFCTKLTTVDDQKYEISEFVSCSIRI
ncbi:MAG TPA: hypothetical protein VNJ01_13045 [Bacteriovoracaceae bacterium]|nr:hypothetical protein [Bacteriovoracaceae bacterium]